MKSKEERAKDSVYWDCDAQEYDVAVAQYLKGATEQDPISRAEQKAIDHSEEHLDWITTVYEEWKNYYENLFDKTNIITFKEWFDNALESK